jgi:hypothetical protein
VARLATALPVIARRKERLTVELRIWISPELRWGAVRAVLLEWSLAALDLWTVLPTGRAATAKVRAFVDFFERNFNA